MFEIIFGWRKASKCKNLVRRVHCRLKFLKIKRHTIVRQLRDDIAQLLKNGHYETASSMVEKLFKEQSLVIVYDLLDHFCEFVIIHFPYIRKHKDCPNDINEAVSTLIFAAAWCGDLPELKMTQKLFGERYGHKFAKAAIELHPGTLVNNQIRENLCTMSIPDNAKLRLIDDITKEYRLQQRLLACDNKFKLTLPKLCENNGCHWEGFVFKGEAEVNYNSLRGAQILASYDEDELTERSFNSNPAELIVEPLQVTAMHRSAAKVENYVQVDEHLYQPEANPSLSCEQSSLEICSADKLCTVSLENTVDMGSKVPPSEVSFQFHKNIVNFEEVKEFQFRKVQDQCTEDKRTFLFNSFIFPLGDCYKFGGASFLLLSHHGNGGHENDRLGSCNSQICQSRQSPALRVEDMEYEQYFGEFLNFSENQKFICHQCGLHGNQWREMPPQVLGRISSFVCREKRWSSQKLHYPRMTQKHICYEKMQGDTCISSSNNCSLEHPCYYSVMEVYNDILVKKFKKLRGTEVSDFSASYFSSHGSCSRGSSPLIQLERGTMAPYARTGTMSPEKLKCRPTENNLHLATSKFQHSERNTSSSFSHVHPKLPDYDELAAKFMALKREHQLKTAEANQGLDVTRD